MTKITIDVASTPADVHFEVIKDIEAPMSTIKSPELPVIEV